MCPLDRAHTGHDWCDVGSGEWFRWCPGTPGLAEREEAHRKVNGPDG